MKEQIMTKLFNDQPLTNEEILFISNHLKDEEIEELHFNHSSQDVYDACSLKKEDVDDIDQTINRRMKEDGRVSHAVELLEADIMSSRKKLRCLIVTHIQQYPGRMTKGLGDTLKGLLDGRRGADIEHIVNINGKHIDLDNIPDDLPDHIKTILKMLRDKGKGGKGL